MQVSDGDRDRNIVLYHRVLFGGRGVQYHPFFGIQHQEKIVLKVGPGFSLLLTYFLMSSLLLMRKRPQ